MTRTLVVDRIEGRVAVLIDDVDGAAHEARLRLLPKGAREGSVLRVPERDGVLDWASAVLDEEARAERAEESRRILDELKKRDPGGDVSL